MGLFIAGIATMYFGTTILVVILGQFGFFEEDILRMMFYAPLALLGVIIKGAIWLFNPIVHFRLTAVLVKNGFNPWGFRFGDVAKLPQSEQEKIIRLSKNPSSLRKVLASYQKGVVE